MGELQKTAPWLKNLGKGGISAGGVGLVLWNLLSNQLKTSALDPAKLMASLGGTFTIKGFSDQLGFRHRFGESFREVCEALAPRALVIIVDDLDRCKPEQVVETLEAINFLTVSGPCFFVLGMARDQVQRAVGLGFKDLAAEMIGPSKNSDEAEAREIRRVYAERYLEKLINIEVAVPRMAPEQAAKFVADVAAAPPAPVQTGWGVSSYRIAAGVIAGLTIAGAVQVSHDGGPALAKKIIELVQSDEAPAIVWDDPPLPAVSQTVPSQSAAPAPAGVSAGVKTTRLAAINTPASPVIRVESGVPLDSRSTASWVVALIVAFAGATGWAINRRRVSHDVIEDKTEFVTALNVWAPAILDKVGSPRGLKRFMNRVRYYAMRQADLPSKIDEQTLVALAAAKELDADAFSGNADQAPLIFSEGKAWIASMKHAETFDSITPTRKEIETFLQIAGGVRFSGSPPDQTTQKA